MKHNLDDLKAEKYESSKETEPGRCPNCGSDEIYQAGREFICLDCGEEF